MLRHRKLLLAFSFVLVGGSLSSSLGYSVYLRSSGYRRSVERGLAAHLNLPADVARGVPLSARSREFTGIKLWLPGRESQIFECERAIWRAQQANGEESFVLDIHEGWFLLGTGEFSREDYRRMLESGLGIDFGELALSAVYLHDMDILWRQPDFALQVRGVDGEVLLDENGLGRANLAAHILNGTEVAEAINIRALFTPGLSLRFHHVALEVPRIPLTSLALHEVLGAPITEGWFDGTLTYRQVEGEQTFSLRGAIGGARLEELTRRLPDGPFRGKVDINLTEATLTRDRLLTLVFNGRVSDIRLGDLAPLLEEPDLGGRINLSVDQARYDAGRLAYLSASADATDVSLTAVTRLLGRGVITGTLRVTVNALLIVDDAVRWADIDLDVVPPADEAGTISREMILYAADKVLGVDLGRAGEYLPEKVEYARMGCKLLIDRDELAIEGSHGPDGRTVLTVRIFNRELGLIKQPERTFPVANLIELVRQRVRDYDVERFMQWWKEDNKTEQHGP